MSQVKWDSPGVGTSDPFYLNNWMTQAWNYVYKNLYIDTSGRVAIGVTPDSIATLTIGGSTGGTIKVTGTLAGLIFDDRANAGNYWQWYATGNVAHLWNTINGNIIDVDLTGVNGIKFAPTQVGNSDANTLDDYEEGTWTPAFGGNTTNGTITYNTPTSGYYTKIGRVVHVSGEIRVNAVSVAPTGNLQIRGFPFVSLNDDTARAGITLFWVNAFSSTTTPRTALMDVNATTATLFQASGDDRTNLSTTESAASLIAGTIIYFGGTYMTAT